MGFFGESDKLILQFMWQCKGARTTKTARGEKKSSLTHSAFKTYYTKLQSTRLCDSGIRIRHTDQQNRTENSEINPSLHLRSTVFLFFLCPQCHMVCRILVLHSGIEPGSSAAKAQSPNLRTARKFPDVNRFSTRVAGQFNR